MATDTSKHLTALRIQNFKRFRDFKLDNIGQFNLVVGKNNTGKTSLLEALLVDEDLLTWVASLATAIAVRQGLEDRIDACELIYIHHVENIEPPIIEIRKSDNLIKYFLKKINIDQDYEGLSALDKEIIKEKEQVFLAYRNEKKILISNLLQRGGYFCPFVPYGLGYGRELLDYLEKTIEKSIVERKRFTERLKLFIPDIVDVRPNSQIINIVLENQDQPVPLYNYGEGTNKLFRILCEIAMAENGRLMIDEIDAGIHHTKFKEFWKVVMQAAIEYNVQIFATTHNEECVDYFQQALEELEEHKEKGRLIKLYEGKENKLYSRVYDFKAMQTAMELGHEVRGGWL